MQSSHSTKQPSAVHVPGEPELWILILADLVIFSIFFIVFMHSGTLNAELFNSTKADLNQLLGMTNTVALLTSSWFVVTGFSLLRASQLKAAKRFYYLAFAMGWVFVIIKICEYMATLDAGVNVSDNLFFICTIFRLPASTCCMSPLGCSVYSRSHAGVIRPRQVTIISFLQKAWASIGT